MDTPAQGGTDIVDEDARDLAAAGEKSELPFTSPFLLAPMEGVTEPCFRELVLARNDARSLGGTFTEFVRVVDQPVPVRRRRPAGHDRQQGQECTGGAGPQTRPMVTG